MDAPSHGRGGTKFTSKGPKPEVLNGFKDGGAPTASEMDLKRVHDNLVHELADDVDRLISDCGPRERESGISQYPGAFQVLLEVFAPVRKYKGAKTEEQAVAGATVALERVTWALSHAGDLEIASAGNHSLKDLEHELAKQQEHHGEE